MNKITITNSKIEGARNIQFQNKYINIDLEYTLDYWDDYFDEKYQQHFFLLGRPAIEENEWESYDNQPAFITRNLIEKYNTLDLKSFCNGINGGFSLVILDYKQNKMIIIRDKMGVYPIFFNQLDEIDSFQVSTHQDVLAQYSSENQLDDTSVAEFLSQGYVMHPNTYYKNIKSMDHASYVSYDFNTKEIEYEQYFEYNFKKDTSYEEALEKLIDALRHSVEIRSLPYYGKTAVLLSGGGDSRLIVNNVKSDIKAITVYDIINKEISTTQKITELLKIPHILIQRSNDTRFNGLMKSPYYTGGMTRGGNGSWVDLIKHEQLSEFDNILTGDYADWLLKDIAFNTQKYTLFGKKLPLNKLSKFEYNFYGPNIKLPELLKKINSRQSLRFEEVKEDLDQLQVRRIIPFSNEYTSSSRLILQRTNQWESIFIDNGVLDAFLELSYQWKLNNKIYNDALAELCKKTYSIPHANTGVKIGTHYLTSAIIQFFKIFKKKYFTSEKNKVFGDNSWGNAKEALIANKELQDQFYDLPDSFKKYINDMLGIDIFSYKIEDIIKMNFHLIYNIMSFYYWIKNIKCFENYYK